MFKASRDKRRRSLGMERAKRRMPQWAKALLVAFLIIASLRFLSWTHLPSAICGWLDGGALWLLGLPRQDWIFTNFYCWLRQFTGVWGELMAFVLVYVVASLFPSRADIQTTKILSIVRGNLRGIDKVYQEVCALLDDVAGDKGSFFIMVSQSPLLGTDLFEDGTHPFTEKLKARRQFGNNRIVCLSAFHRMKDDVRTWLRGFYDDLAAYSPPSPEDKQARLPTMNKPAATMYNEARALVTEIMPDANTDVVFADSIPYQVFLVRHSDGTKKCVFLLSGWEAIRRHLPSGGFVSEDSHFIDLIEDAIAVQLGTHASIYSLRFMHTKAILKRGEDYAEACGSPTTAAGFMFPPEMTQPNTFEMHGLQFFRYPWVFDPSDAESGSISAKTLCREIGLAKRRRGKTGAGTSPLRVWDIGCGSGSASVLAAKTGDAEVRAVDINDFAVECTNANAKKHGVDGVVRAEKNPDQSPDAVFKPFGTEKADIIFADLPFLDCFLPERADHKDQIAFLRAAYLDEGQALNISVLGKAANYLNDGGRLLISFSDLDSVADFQEEIRRTGWFLDPRSDRPARNHGHDWYVFVLTRR